MILLYIIFFQIGLLSFGGGYVILPLIENYIVDTYKWINTETLINVIAISQVTPGPIAINASTFIGMQKFGFLGALFATLGVISPQIILLIIFIKYLGFNNKIIKKIIDGINPASVALIGIATLNISQKSIFLEKNKLDYRVIFCIFLTFLLVKLKIKNIYIIVLSGIISAFLMF